MKGSGRKLNTKLMKHIFACPFNLPIMLAQSLVGVKSKIEFLNGRRQGSTTKSSFSEGHGLGGHLI